MGVENASSSAVTKREFDEPAGGPDLTYTVSGSDGITRFGPQTVTGPWYMPPAYISGGTSDPPLYSPASVRRNVVTFTRTLTCSATATAQSIPEASGSLSYTVGIHAQPYDFHQTQVIDNGNGTLKFTYGWQSTTGDITNLTTCFEHERVTYPDSDPYIAPPPFDQSVGYHNPTVAPGTGTDGIEMNETDTNLDNQHVFATVSPYSAVTITAAQRYEFDDTATGETNILIPGPDSTASITRRIYSTGTPPTWYYSVIKNGSMAEKALQ